MRTLAGGGCAPTRGTDQVSGIVARPQPHVIRADYFDGLKLLDIAAAKK